MSFYEEATEQLLDIGTSKKINHLVDKGMIPLGTKRPYFTYTKRIEDKDIVWLPYTEATSPEGILILAGTGQMKTVLMKRIAYYYYLNNYNIAVFEPKMPEWSRAKRKPFREKLHPLEDPDTMPIENYVPSFVLEDIPDEVIEDCKRVTANMSEFNKKRYFSTLRFSPTAVDFLSSNIQKGKLDTPKKLLDTIRKKKMGSTKRNLMGRLQALEDDNFFDERYHSFSKEVIKKAWLKRTIPTLTLFSQDNSYISLYVGHTLREIYHLSIADNRFLKKLIIVDDCSLLAGKEMKDEEYLSVKELKNTITLWRLAGFQMVFATQSLGLVQSFIPDNCKWFIIGKIGKPTELKDYIANPIILDEIRNLNYSPASYTHEYLLVHPDRLTYETFYPFNPPVGHFK